MIWECAWKREKEVKPALIAQLLHYPLYSGPALTAVWGHSVDNDSLHVRGEGNPLHCHHSLLSHHRPAGVLRIRCVCHLLLHVDKVAEGHVLGSHLHQAVLGVHGGILACIANLIRQIEIRFICQYNGKLTLLAPINLWTQSARPQSDEIILENKNFRFVN